jgi:hypothetical protein
MKITTTQTTKNDKLLLVSGKCNRTVADKETDKKWT